MSLAINLIRLQKEHGETNYRLAKAIGVSQTSIKNWRDGVRIPHPRHVRLIAAHYGVSEDELIGRKEGAPDE